MTSTSRRKCFFHAGASYQNPPLTMSSLPSLFTSITPQAGYSAAGLMSCGTKATCWAGREAIRHGTNRTNGTNMGNESGRMERSPEPRVMEGGGCQCIARSGQSRPVFLPQMGEGSKGAKDHPSCLPLRLRVLATLPWRRGRCLGGELARIGSSTSAIQRGPSHVNERAACVETHSCRDRCLGCCFTQHPAGAARRRDWRG